MKDIVTAAVLDRWAREAWEGRRFAEAAETAAARGNLVSAQRQASLAAEALRVLAVDMERHGAERPKEMVPRNAVPLHLLSTPTSRAYADAMRKAAELARAVDHERGYGDDGPADFVEGFAIDAEQEAFGAVGKLRE